MTRVNYPLTPNLKSISYFVKRLAQNINQVGKHEVSVGQINARRIGRKKLFRTQETVDNRIKCVHQSKLISFEYTGASFDCMYQYNYALLIVF